jgi:hypothetical protein
MINPSSTQRVAAATSAGISRTEPAVPVAGAQAGASDLLVVPVALVAHAVPVAALVAQGGLKNPGEAAAIPIWIVGFTCGLGAWAVARHLSAGRTDWLSRYLDTPVPYLVIGFLIWMISGFILYS